MTRLSQPPMHLSGETKLQPDLRRGGISYASKLRAVDRLASDIVSKVETTLTENPGVILNRSSTNLPREVEDRQAYFLEKVSHVRRILSDLAELLELTSAAADDRELLKGELAMLFVLIQSYRPEYMSESGWHPSHDVRTAVEEKVESLSLDIINLRERLK